MTICAISTALGTGGIAVARISGPQAIEITDKIWRGKSLSAAKSHTARLGTIFDPDTKEDLDSAVATVYRSPKSFTGEDVVELSVHGSTWIQRELINILIRNGARLAEPGEFSRRAFAAGKMDLAEAEAVADMIASSSRAAHRIAMSQMRGDYSRRLSKMRDDLLQLCALLELELDFSEEDVEFADRTTLITLAETIHETVTRMSASFATGNALKNGVPVAIIGATNAGKSTLLNRLLEDDKAIVSSIHGTTRDTIEDTAEINGILFRFIDTAGLRETTDPIESIGINRSLTAISRANILLWMIDPSNPKLEETATQIKEHLNAETTIIAVINKADLGLTPPPLPDFVSTSILISAKTDHDLSPLHDALTHAVNTDSTPTDMTVTNARHCQSLLLAAQATTSAISALKSQLPADLVAQDLRQTIHHLATITGDITTPDILSHIFSHFCIGK